MPRIILGDRSLITFSGPDAEHLLHNVVTCNIETIPEGVAQIGALLTPQGKIMFEFFVGKKNDGSFLIEIAKESAPSFMQKMIMYRLRSKVEIVESSESFVQISWGDDLIVSEADFQDTRFSNQTVHRNYRDSGPVTGREAWDHLRIANGVAESGFDYTLGDAFPHDVSFDQNQGVDFGKGCYIGQEVVSRMHHRHTARRRILIAQADKNLDQESTITSDGKALGTLGTIVDKQALALCRIDRVKDALDAGTPILVGDTEIALSIPPHVTYQWPSGSENG